MANVGELTKAASIWNRACLGGADVLLAGDRALAAMLIFHSAVMNGGVMHAVECLETEALVAAELGYRFFGFEDAAHLLREVESRSKSDEGLDLDRIEVEIDERYQAIIPDDSTLVDRFEAVLRQSAGEFAPV